jgi:glycine cleavage system H protein
MTTHHSPLTTHLTFLMGKFPAALPVDRRYARNHMWCQEVDGWRRFGFSAYAVRLMQDVYFLDWVVNDGDMVELLQQIGHIETSKAVSDLFAPIAGKLTRFNPGLLKDPTPINLDNYGAGWLFEMEGDAAPTLTVEDYHRFLTDNWEKTQRMIKGRINEDM